MKNPNQEVIAAYRAAADWLEAHPELPPVYCGNIGMFIQGNDQKSEVALIAKAMGKAEKRYTDDSLHLVKRWGDEYGPNIAYVAARDQVCERVQVGTRIEPAHVRPATEECFIPAQEVPIYEWRCGSILADAATQPETEAQ